jgi:hypothetical protein
MASFKSTSRAKAESTLVCTQVSLRGYSLSGVQVPAGQVQENKAETSNAAEGLAMRLEGDARALSKKCRM